MPTTVTDDIAQIAALYLWTGTASGRAVAVAVTATQDETAVQFLRAAAALYGWDGADLSRVLVESAASPNLRFAVYDGAVGPADVAAAAVTLDETAATFLKTMGAIYGMGTLDLERLITGSVGIATLQDTVGTGILPHILMGVFDDTAPTSITENQFGALRATTTRVLLTVTADPTTPTQRRAVNASGSAQSIEQVAALAPITGQTQIAITGTAVQLPANVLIKGVTVKADTANANVITVGPAAVTNTANGTGNGFVLRPGDSVSLEVDNTNRVYVNGTATQWVSWAAL